jgi:hypothetical protein
MQAIVVRIVFLIRKSIHIHLIYAIIRCVTSLLNPALLSFLAICGLLSPSVSVRGRVFKNHDRCLGPVIVSVNSMSHWLYRYQSNLVPLCLIPLVMVNAIKVNLLSIFMCGTHILDHNYS